MRKNRNGLLNACIVCSKNPPHNHISKWYQRIRLYTHNLFYFFLNISSFTKFLRNDLHAPFLFQTLHLIWSFIETGTLLKITVLHWFFSFQWIEMQKYGTVNKLVRWYFLLSCPKTYVALLHYIFSFHFKYKSKQYNLFFFSKNLFRETEEDQANLSNYVVHDDLVHRYGGCFERPYLNSRT